MKNIGLIAAVAVMAVATTAYGADYYVDANNGNDAWDGTTATIPDPATIEAGGTIAGPRKTLHAMMSDARVVAGDTVWAAEGDYKEGGTVNGSLKTINRVQVKGGVMLRASGAREATFISGANGDAGTYSNGATRCVFFLAPSQSSDGYGIVKGFTIRKGRTCADDGTDGYGGASTGTGLMVECDFQSNACWDKSRGGTMNGGYAIRCKFTSASNGYQGYNAAWVINSLILDGGFYKNCKLVNCTVLGSSYTRNSDTYNCLFIGTGATSSSQSISGSSKSEHNRTYSRSEFSLENCTTSDFCRVVSEVETPYDGTTYRPLPNSVAIDAGNTSYYVTTTNKTAWKRGRWLAEAGKDYYGNDRVVNGKIDVGCGEAQVDSPLTISDDSDGLVVTGAAIGTTVIPEGSSIDVTFARNFTSDKLCTGVEVNGEFHSFGGTTSDVPYAVTVAGVLGGIYNVAAVYETDQKDWYVSPTGDDTNKGYHKNCPRKTLAKAMELATANADNVVHAAAGVYDSFAEGTDERSRVTVKAGVGLVADDWPLQETIIKGASDTTSETRDKYGNGPKAVRCVTVNKKGYVRGFKLMNGRTSLTNDVGTSAQGGACGGCAILYSPAALIDCEITGNGAHYRGIVASSVEGSSGDLSWLIRCYVHGNDTHGGAYQLFDRTSVVDTYVDGETPFYCRGNAVILNSTFVGGTARSWNNSNAYNSYLYKVSRGGGTFKLYNCAFSVDRDKSGVDKENIEPDEACIFSAPTADNLDGNNRPKTAASVLVDAGVKDYYDEKFPAQFAQFKTNRDLAGGQRIYNGQIDIGCGEYDFRPDFAVMLGPRAVISEMGPNVTTNDVPNVVVPEGESITMSVPPKQGKEARYELVYTPEGGEPATISETSSNGFRHTLDGPCTVQSLLVRGGFFIMFR